MSINWVSTSYEKASRFTKGKSMIIDEYGQFTYPIYFSIVLSCHKAKIFDIDRFMWVLEFVDDTSKIHEESEICFM